MGGWRGSGGGGRPRLVGPLRLDGGARHGKTSLVASHGCGGGGSGFPPLRHRAAAGALRRVWTCGFGGEIGGFGGRLVGGSGRRRVPRRRHRGAGLGHVLLRHLPLPPAGVWSWSFSRQGVRRRFRRRLGAWIWSKSCSLVALAVVWWQVGGPGGGRRVSRGRTTRLGCGQAVMAARVAWLRVVGGTGMRRRG